MSTKFYNLKQQISNNPEIDEAVSEKAIKEYVDKTGLQLINPTTTAGSSSSPYLAVKWDVSDVGGVTTVSDGMRVLARVNAVGVSSGGLLLSIDGGTTYHPVVYAASTIPTSTYMVTGTTVLLIYNADATATCYGTAGTSTSYTGCWQLDYHFTLYMYRLLHNNGTYVTKTDLKRYKLMVQYDETTMLPISSGSSTSGHTIDTTNAFMPFGQICYCNTSTTNYKSAGAAIGASVLANMYAFDLRYTFNGGTTMLTANKDVYLVANPQSDGKAKIDSSPLTQTLPSTEDNKIYIYLGHTYSAYQIELHPVHPIYYYKDGAIREWTNSATSADANYYHTPQFNSGLKIGVGTGVADLYVPKGSNAEFGVLMIGTSGDDAAAGNHTHGNITNGGTLTDTAAAASGNDYVVIRDATDAKIQTSTIKGVDVSDAVSKKHSHSNITLSTTAQAYDGSHTIAMPSSDPYTSARTPSSHTHGNIQNGGTLQTNDVAIANGDKLIVTDSSDSSKVARTSVAFDGSTTNKYLSPKGTWETLPTIPETPVCQTTQTTAVSGDTYTASITGFTATLTNFRFALVLKQAPGTQGNIKININSTGAQYVRYWNADGQSVSLLGGNSVQQGDVLDITYGVSSGLTLIAIKRGGTNAVSGSVTSVQVQATSPVQSSTSTAQTGTLNTTISLASAYGDTQNPYGSKTANQVLAAPNGSNGNPSFRSLVAADIPALGNIQNSGALQTNDITIANGDKLVVTDSSDSNKVARASLSFDTTNTTQYLRADGTWGTPAGSGDTGYAYELLPDNTTNITYNNSKAYLQVGVTGTTQTFNLAVNNTCTNYLLVTNEGSGDCAIAIGVQSGTRYEHVIKPSAGITLASGKAVELSFMSIKSHRILVVTVSAEMEIDTLS